MSHLSSPLGPITGSTISGSLASPAGPSYLPSFSPSYVLRGGGIGYIVDRTIATGQFWQGEFQSELASPLGPIYLPDQGVVEKFGDADEDLTFAEEGEAFVVRAAASEDTLVLDELLARAIEVTSDDTLTFSEDADVEVPRSAVEALTFNEDVDVDQVRRLFESFTLSEAETGIGVHPRTTSETLDFVEVMERYLRFDVEESILILEEADTILGRQAVDILSFSETASKVKHKPQSLSEAFEILEELVRVHERDASESLSLVEALYRIKEAQASESFSLAEVASQSAVKLVVEALIFTEEPNRDGSIYARTVAESFEIDELGIVSFLGGDSPCLETYDAGLGIRTGLRLTYPYAAPALTLDLRVPKFGNVHQVTKNIKVKRTVSGQLRVARSSTWPVVEELKMSFEALTRAQRDDLWTFIQASSAQEIGLLDHEDRQWRGIISSSKVSAAQDGRSECDYSASFTFRGRLE